MQPLPQASSWPGSERQVHSREGDPVAAGARVLAGPTDGEEGHRFGGLAQPVAAGHRALCRKGPPQTYDLKHKIIIVTDSQAACRAFAGNTLYPRTAHLINAISIEWLQIPVIRIIWTPAHLGLSGNESAHALARAVATNRALSDGIRIQRDPEPNTPADSQSFRTLTDAHLNTYHLVTEYYRTTRRVLPPPHRELSRAEAADWRQLQTFTFPNLHQRHRWFPNRYSGTCPGCGSDHPDVYHSTWECPHPLVLDGSAKMWFRFAGEFTSWGSFVTALHSQFAPVDKKRLKEELWKRTQHTEENLKQFIYVISSYNDRIGEPVTGTQKVERVLRQMHPQFRDLIEGRTFATLKELADAADGLMDRVWQRLQYVPPPQLSNQVVRDLVFQSRTATPVTRPVPVTDQSSLDHAHPRCFKRALLFPFLGSPVWYSTCTAIKQIGTFQPIDKNNLALPIVTVEEQHQSSAAP
ncbi:hypothetical protein HPB47_013824 [Ixodes persulcatus]|uniref:Uncharacterized protein n=1 Tax=Ixodes persulcatus TaxID=34615 RepID=A0AC60QXJ6_IXOPE|nr:hypothetical protein HPB47_013824 [Ixodes persulcatus]